MQHLNKQGKFRTCICTIISGKLCEFCCDVVGISVLPAIKENKMDVENTKCDSPGIGATSSP